MKSILDESVLVLNRSWSAIETTTVRDAFCKVIGEKAKIINVEDNSEHDFLSWAELPPWKGHLSIRTAYMNIRVPEVIVLTSEYHVRTKEKVTFSKRNLIKRDNYTCMYCGEKLESAHLTIDHILPRARGGKSNFLNCVISCWDCNSHKDNKTPEEAGMKLRIKPFEPKWTPLFRIAPHKHKESWKNFI